MNTTVNEGEYLDFALTPVGPGGDTGDGSDGSHMTATILAGTVMEPEPPAPPGMVVADSAADY
ncbi:MAG TPA: hypothetical protein VLV83_26100, partial [Acidobacteriota bacterium]|nr:hypothetical protein [Acidobacteriota bacterium]